MTTTPPKDKYLDELLEIVRRLPHADQIAVLKRAKKLLRWQKKAAQKAAAK